MADDFKFDDEDWPKEFRGNPLDGDDAELDESDQIEKEVKVVGVYEHTDPSTNQSSAFVVLRDATGRSVVIFIGRFEAAAIWLALEGTSADRPLTHDLLNNIIAKMGGTVERILIDDLWNDTYYAKVTIIHDGKEIEIDSRPSDAIALSLRAKAPIFMAEQVLRKAAVKEE